MTQDRIEQGPTNFLEDVRYADAMVAQGELHGVIVEYGEVEHPLSPRARFWGTVMSPAEEAALRRKPDIAFALDRITREQQLARIRDAMAAGKSLIGMSRTPDGEPPPKIPLTNLAGRGYAAYGSTRREAIDRTLADYKKRLSDRQ